MLTRTASDDRLMGDHGAAPASPRGTGVVCVMGAGLSASRCAGAGAQVCRGGVCFGLAGPEPRATGAQFCLELRISRRKVRATAFIEIWVYVSVVIKLSHFLPKKEESRIITIFFIKIDSNR